MQMHVNELLQRLAEIDDQVRKSPGPSLIAPMGDEFAMAVRMAGKLQRDLHEDGHDVIIQYSPTFMKFILRRP